MPDKKTQKECYRDVIVDMLKGKGSEILKEKTGIDWMPVITAAFIYLKAVEKKCAPIEVKQAIIDALITAAMKEGTDGPEVATGVHRYYAIANALVQLRGTQFLFNKLDELRGLEETVVIIGQIKRLEAVKANFPKNK